MKCWSCGREMGEGSLFCGNCGSKAAEQDDGGHGGPDTVNGAVKQGGDATMKEGLEEEGRAGEDAEAETGGGSGAETGAKSEKGAGMEAATGAEAGEGTESGTGAQAGAGSDSVAGENTDAGTEAGPETQAGAGTGSRTKDEAGDGTGEETETGAHIGPTEAKNADQLFQVFCPKCGKRFKEGDLFCDDCGSGLSNEATVHTTGCENLREEQMSEIQNPWGKALLLAFAVIAVVAAGVMGIGLLKGKASTPPKKLAYFQGEALMLADLKNKGEMPVEITDSYIKDGGYYSWEEVLSEDGKYLFYKEEFDGDTYNLYRAKTSAPREGEKIDSRVTSHMVLKNNGVLYVKKGSLYYLKGKDFIKFGKNVYDEEYGVDEDLKHVYWCEQKDGDFALTYYYQDIGQKDEKVKLADHVKEFYPNKELTRFYALKNNTLYELDNEGGRNRIAGNVDNIVCLDTDSGEIYYAKSAPQRVNYQEIVYDDTNSMSAGDKQNLGYNSYEMETYELYYYGKDGEVKISDHYRKYSGNFYGDNYIIFREFPDIDKIQVNWSELKEGSTGSWDYTVDSVLKRQAPVKLHKGGQEIAVYNDIQSAQFRYNQDSDKLYIYSESADGENGTIYVTSLKGKEAGVLTEYETDVSSGRLMLASQDGLYYLKDCEDWSAGDLYFNGEKIASDVCGVTRFKAGGALLYATDMEDQEDYNYTYDLRILNGDKSTPVAKDVAFTEYAQDGTMVLLADADFVTGEGDLMYYDGKELRKLDEDVRAVAIRKGSMSMIGNTIYGRPYLTSSWY